MFFVWIKKHFSLWRDLSSHGLINLQNLQVILIRGKEYRNDPAVVPRGEVNAKMGQLSMETTIIRNFEN